MQAPWLRIEPCGVPLEWGQVARGMMRKSREHGPRGPRVGGAITSRYGGRVRRVRCWTTRVWRRHWSAGSAKERNLSHSSALIAACIAAYTSDSALHLTPACAANRNCVRYRGSDTARGPQCALVLARGVEATRRRGALCGVLRAENGPDGRPCSAFRVNRARLYRRVRL